LVTSYLTPRKQFRNRLKVIAGSCGELRTHGLVDDALDLIVPLAPAAHAESMSDLRNRRRK